MLHARPRDRHDALHQRQPVIKQIGDRGGGANVVRQDPEVEWQPAGGDLLPEQRHEQHLLGALGVLHLNAHHLHRGGGNGLECFDRIGLVELDSDPAPLASQQEAEDLRTADHGGGLLDHHTVVTRQVWLTLAAVDDDLVHHFAVGHGELDVAGEGCAAEADDATVLDELEGFARLQRRGVGGLAHELLAGPRVAAEHDRRDHAPTGVETQFDGGDTAGNGGVQRNRDETTGIGQLVTPAHVIAWLHYCHARRADMLAKGEHVLVDERCPLDR